MHSRRGLALVVALFVAGTFVAAQNVQQDEKKRNKQEQQDIETLAALVDSAAAGLPVNGDLPAKVTLTVSKDAPVSIPEAGAGDIPIKWESSHFVKGQDGKTYIPFTLKLDPALKGKSLSMYVRAVDKKAAAATPTATSGRDKNDKKKIEPAWENAHFLEVPESGTVSRAMAVSGGEYELFIGLKEKNTGDRKQVAKVGLMRKDLTVPDFAQTELTTSSVILADSVEPVQTAMTNEQQQENPYTFGMVKIVPTTNPAFKKSGLLQVIFWIYGATQDASGKPDVEIQYNFHQKTAEGEKYFNKTQPVQLNASSGSLPPQFNMAAGHQLPGSLEIKLESFPVGEYRLEIKVTDKPSGKSLTRDVPFSVGE
jgi:hypothetical protein